MLSRLPLLATLLLGLAAAPDDERQADTVFLLDGKSRTGRVVYEDPQTLILRRGSKDTEIPQAEIKEVDAVWRHLPDLLERLAKLGPLNGAAPAELLELARFAEQARLPGEAEILRLAALLRAPDDTDILDTLGLRTRKSGTQFKLADTWRSMGELGTPPENWKERWKLRTTHYELQSNQALGDALAAALDAERFFIAFYALLAEPVELLETREPMELRLYVDEKAFPEPGDGRRGFFDESDFTVYVDVRGEGWPERVVHELTRQLIFETSLNSTRARGEVPRWIQEGLAMAFANGRRGSPGDAAYDPAALHEDAVRTQWRAGEDTYDLSQVLVFSYVDFAAKQKQDLKYAQAYTLLHTLLWGDDGKQREAFLRFLRSAYAGQGSPSDLQDELGLDKDEIDELWVEHMSRLVRQL